MATPCYCCPLHKGKVQPTEKQPHNMDLDAALHELGMLSTITNSRKEYIGEKMKKEKHSNQIQSAGSVCVVQMNTDFVTKFTFSKSSSVLINSESENNENESSFNLKNKNILHCKSRRMKRDRRYMYKPYDFPWRPKLEESLKTLSATFPVTSEGSSVLTVPRQDSGNKSNPGSPVKSQKIAANAGCSIFRSRSLDDLEISKLEIKDGCSNEAGRAEIETVSQRISNLHVS